MIQLGKGGCWTDLCLYVVLDGYEIGRKYDKGKDQTNQKVVAS